MSGVFGILVGMRRLSGILIVLVFNILSKLILFSPTSNKNLVNVMASGLFPFLMTLIFTVKFIFIDISHMFGHFIIDAFTIKDIEPFGITSNIWRGSPQKINILLPKNVLFFVMSLIIRSTASILCECVINASSHISNSVARIKCPNLLFAFVEQVDVFEIGMGIPNVLCAVRPPFKSVAAIPDEAVAIHFFPIPLA